MCLGGSDDEMDAVQVVVEDVLNGFEELFETMKELSKWIEYEKLAELCKVKGIQQYKEQIRQKLSGQTRIRCEARALLLCRGKDHPTTEDEVLDSYLALQFYRILPYVIKGKEMLQCSLLKPAIQVILSEFRDGLIPDDVGKRHLLA